MILLNDEEITALYGAPYLHRALYIFGIRAYMDYRTGIVGVKRKISWQSLSEEVYVEPCKGVATVRVSKDQLRRAAKHLQRLGLLRALSDRDTLIFECLMAKRDHYIQNKAAMKPPGDGAMEVARGEKQKSPVGSGLPEAERPKGARDGTRGAMGKAAIPPLYINNFSFLSEQFEQFWKNYPVKKSKQKAWAIFQGLVPSEDLFQNMLSGLKAQKQSIQAQVALGHWVPHWKYPANWLQDRSWEDEIMPVFEKEKRYENDTRHRRRAKTGSEVIWESCKRGIQKTQCQIIDFEDKGK